MTSISKVLHHYQFTNKIGGGLAVRITIPQCEYKMDRGSSQLTTDPHLG